MPLAKPALTGSCACGEIVFSSRSLPLQSSVCNCVICRKSSGAPFQIYAEFHSSDVDVTHRGQKVNPSSPPATQGGFSTYKLSDHAVRGVCIACHSHISFSYLGHPEVISIAVGAIDETSLADDVAEQTLRPTKHIFGGQRTSWWPIDDDGIPIHERFSTGFDPAGSRIS